MKLRVFEAFAGYGSQSIALRNIGVDYEIVAISEIDKYVLQAYYTLHDKNIPNLGDISKIKVEDVPQHDLFTYSFPCQDLSVAGKQKGMIKDKTRSGLLYECEKIIEYHRPKYLLMENVKNLVGKKFKAQFDKWLEYLEGLGYTNYWKVLNAKDFGIPQNRERVFVVSILGEHKPYEFPNPIPLDKTIESVLEDKVDEKYYLSDDKVKNMKLNLKGRNPKNPSSRVSGLPTEHKKILLKESVCPSLTTMQGGNEQPKIVFEQRCDEGMRFFKDNCVGTIRTIDSGGDKRVLEGDCRIRKLTPRECFRLMGLKDSDIDKIQATGFSNSQQYKMAGNSIVINVVEEIFKNLFDINN